MEGDQSVARGPGEIFGYHEWKMKTVARVNRRKRVPFYRPDKIVAEQKRAVTPRNMKRDAQPIWRVKLFQN